MMHAMLGRQGATVGTQAAAERQIVGGILSCKAPQAAAPRAQCHAQPGQCRRDVRAAYTRGVLESQDLVGEVSDVMSCRRFITCQPSDSVDHALELLVEHDVTGLPVLDESGRVVGIVSDYDLLALECMGVASKSRSELFPEAEQTWQAFKQVTQVIAKGTGKKVSDVMTAHPVTVTPSTCINEATSLLIKKGVRRLPVVDEQGRLVGMLSRRDVVKAALQCRRGFCNLAELSVDSADSSLE